jgi:chromosomal replication initiation ATPase DnaA
MRFIDLCKVLYRTAVKNSRISHRRLKAIQVGNDVYVELSAGETAVATGTEVVAGRIDAVVSAKLGPARVRGNGQPAAFHRQIAMYLAHRVGGWSTTRIGRFYNGRDHSTVCHAIKRPKRFAMPMLRLRVSCLH